MRRSDREIWVDVLAGNAKAWSELVNRYQALVYSIATRSGLSSAEAGDCFQHTWIALYQNRTSVKDPDQLSSWLSTTARREAYRLKKRAWAAESLDQAPEPIDDTELPDETLERLQLQSQFESALGSIDVRCRKLLYALFFSPKEESYREIAERLGISMNSLGPTRQRCLEKLKKELQRMGVLDVRKGE
ncbi:MAG: RNA polymerase sigma factor [Candidatus Zixiibacteriota bacterium]